VTGQSSLEDTLTRIVAVTAESLAGDVGGITLIDQSGRAATVGFNDPVVADIDEAQYGPSVGPCLEAVRTGQVVRTIDITTDERWPEFARAAAAHGIGSTLSLPMIGENDHPVGALNVYARRTGAFDATSEEFGRAFAKQATIGISFWEKTTIVDHLRLALESRAEIEQAKGIIMAASGCSADEAFDMLRQQSQAENRKLRDIAAELVARQRRAH
jgi:hypothetical protein